MFRHALIVLAMDAADNRSLSQKQEVGKDAVAAHKAVGEFVASGRQGSDYVAQMWKMLSDADGKQDAAKQKQLVAEINKLIVELGSGEFLERITAQDKLGKLDPAAIPILEKQLAAKPAAGVRAALVKVIRLLRKTASGPGGKVQQQRLIASRVARVQRISGRTTAGMRISGSDDSNLSGLTDGFVADENMTGQEAPRYIWWQSGRGKEGWVRYDFDEERTFDSADVFWLENKGYSKGSKLPESWSLSYLDRKDWKPIKPKQAYGITFGKYDRVEFAPVRTKSIRLTAKSIPTANRMGLLEFRLGEKNPE